jgi:D-alanyl-lipoteichoic acid acyltransferase DltB (MBOAT superfamily)
LLFNSLPFFIFLPLVVLIYYLLPFRVRWIFLLASGYIFYGFLQPQFLVLLLLSTCVDFYFALKISESKNNSFKKAYLAASLCFNIGLLFVFKYLSLFLKDIDPMMANIYRAEHPIKGMVMNAIYFSIPVGISFYTFQSLSYTFDVYYGRQKAETSLPRYAAFVAYFPPLVAGPIERFHHLSTQIFANHKPLYKNFANGFRLMLLGFFLKMCIADNAGNYTDLVFNRPEDYSSSSVLLGMVMFGIQIYADFSGYSLIAQGASIWLGIQLVDNFRTPYLSSSVTQFWKRWHISLTTWFKDYLYIPLGGNKVGVPRWVVNILLVFLVSGFWHGANYTFIAWGAIHGLAYLAEHFTKPILNLSESKFKIFRLIGGIKTFVIVTIAWVFFRANNFEHAKHIFKSVLKPLGTQTLEVTNFVWLVMGVFVLFDVMLYNKRIDSFLESKKWGIRWLVYAVLLGCILMFAGTVKHPFVYFQF